MEYNWKNMSEDEKIKIHINDCFDSIREHFINLMYYLVRLHKNNKDSCDYWIYNIESLLFERMLSEFIVKEEENLNDQDFIDVLEKITQRIASEHSYVDIEDIHKFVDNIKKQNLNADKI